MCCCGAVAVKAVSCLSVWFSAALTRPGVVLDPVQQLLLRQVAELSDDPPLSLQVGQALHGHDGQHRKHQHLQPQLLPDPAKQLGGREREIKGKRKRESERQRREKGREGQREIERGRKARTCVRHLLSAAKSQLSRAVCAGAGRTCLEQSSDAMMHMCGVRKSLRRMMRTARTAKASSCRLW